MDVAVDADAGVDADFDEPPSPPPPHATNSTIATTAVLPQIQMRSTPPAYGSTGPEVHSAASNHVHSHGVIVSNGPAKVTPVRDRSIGASSAATALGSASSQATVMRSSPGCHG